MPHLKHPVSDDMLERLRYAAASYSEFVDVMLDEPHGRYGGTEGRTTLINVLSLLIGLTGSEDAAIAWLFDSRGYTAVVGADVCLALAQGEFWTLATLGDWLQVIDAHQHLCPDLIRAVFREDAASSRDTP